MNILKRILRDPSTFIVAIVFLLVFKPSKEGIKVDKQREFITSDGIGYYSYLPAIFIYDDLSLSFLPAVHKRNYSRSGLPEFTNEFNGKKVNKYFSGEALLLLPFFLLAHLLAYLFGFSADGYSGIYQWAVFVAALFYLWIGLVFLFRILKEYSSSGLLNFFTVCFVVFGTNLFYYVYYEPSMSHVYSFALICMFIYYASAYFRQGFYKHALGACVVLGLIVLVRPVNGLVLLILPFLAGTSEALLARSKELIANKKLLVVIIVIPLLIVLIQTFVWYLQCGKFMVWSYKGESFIFTQPHFIGLLFSYQKGFFIYTPIAFLSLLGFIKIYRESAYRFYTLSIFMIVLVYVLSCWWSWYYGMSFGMRALIDYYPLLAILVICSFTLLRSSLVRFIWAIPYFMLVYLCLVQTYQYKEFILHWDQMTKESYWKVFMKTGDEYRGVLWEKPDEKVNGELEPLSRYYNDLEKEQSFWTLNKVSNDAHSGKVASLSNNQYEYGSTFELKADSVLAHQDDLLLKIVFWAKSLTAGAPTGAMVVSIDSAGVNYYYETKRLFAPGETTVDRWKNKDFTFKLPKLKSRADVIKIYPWNPKGEGLVVDDIEVSFYQVKASK